MIVWRGPAHAGLRSDCECTRIFSKLPEAVLFDPRRLPPRRR